MNRKKFYRKIVKALAQGQDHDLHHEKDRRGLKSAMSQVFSDRQEEILFKKLARKDLTKTEREYFSRVIKKKAMALANVQLHHLAQRLLQA